MTTQRYPGTGHPPVDSPSLQSSAYMLAHLRACLEAGEPSLVEDALAALPEWVSFYEVRELLKQGGFRFSMQPIGGQDDPAPPRRRARD